MKIQKTILTIIVIALIILGGWYLFTNSSSDEPLVDTNPTNTVNTGDTVILVNDEEISRDQFEAFKSQISAQEGIDLASLDAETEVQLEAQIAEELVSQKLLEQAVEASGIEASPEEVDEQMEAMKAQFGGEEAFQELLNAEGLSEEDLRTQISADITTQAYLEQELNLSSITASDEEIEAAYQLAAAQDENIPPLEDIRPQIEQHLIEQKKQPLVVELVDSLRQEADIEILL